MKSRETMSKNPASGVCLGYKGSALVVGLCGERFEGYRLG